MTNGARVLFLLLAFGVLTGCEREAVKTNDAGMCAQRSQAEASEEPDATTRALKLRRLFKRCMGDRGYRFDDGETDRACNPAETTDLPKPSCYAKEQD